MILGSLFQGVMDPRERRQAGGHYTSQRDILRLVQTLFLDDLRDEFHRVRDDTRLLRRFHRRLSKLRFLDPACGCGDFLVITYRELRLLEIEVLRALCRGVRRQPGRPRPLVGVDAFYGIEIDERAARIAEVAMWMMDHQMNVRLSEVFGDYVVRLPLTKSPTIVCGNALRMDWNERLLPAERCSYVLGNPPFVGKKARNADQQADLELVFRGARGTGILDYVCCWYLRTAEYIRGTSVRAALVSTSSITQGEQPGVLWPILSRQFGLKIHFAHRTFAWESEARGKAHVHVVIVGFAAFDTTGKRVFDYESDRGTATVTTARNISPYLVEGPDETLANRESPIGGVPRMQFGSMPNDGGHLVLSDEEKQELLANEPECEPFIRPLLSAHEYLHGKPRWCLWLKDASPHAVRRLAEVKRRVEAVRAYRAASARPTTKKLASYPSLFGEIRQPAGRFVLIPRHTSENRRYIPLSYFSPQFVPSDSCLFLERATWYHFGVLSSAMHMAWVRQVCGRLESRYRYSAKLVYNNFPWPETPSAKSCSPIEEAALGIVGARQRHVEAGACLADLYDPAAMPTDLTKAHTRLDRAVERCYRAQPFTTDLQRIEFLFARYQAIIQPLTASPSKKKRPRA